MINASIKAAMPVTTEYSTVEVTISRIDAAQPIAVMTIATIVPLRKRIARTMDFAWIIPLIVAKTIVSHIAIKAVTTGVVIASMTAMEAGRNSIAKINAIVAFTNRVLMCTRIAI